MKKACGGALITATDKMRVVLNDKQKGLYKHKLKKQHNILEALIGAENEKTMQSIVAPKRQQTNIKHDIICAHQAAYFNKSMAGADKLVKAQEMLIYDNIAKTIEMAVSDGLLIEDTKGDDKHTRIRGDEDGRIQKEKFKATRNLREFGGNG
ncbi:hypothetical protein SARC_11051 [Sphaeroforma arctica JP610]|uniref:Uncharacterized protein n=1 Tax=Sphaeroforma arctica JP610 TaxID=667725 RepID=A0A0L0FI69_9EUKA|nr:hypothetical protein SARC_11051 [Sphaeroforma arctica JP610]KNC76450.1 hypothetical protein SARC_11051 [Sphaeroforma arctica JP610]|eukprot:XP_014150352.1 hypothetical protein SARC_11051 [Sphaeroforma arctica JP610]